MKPREILSQEEMDSLLRKSDLRGAIEIFTTWGLIAGAFAGVALWPHLPTIFVPLLFAWVLLGNRHLALAILVHDAGHRAIFKTKSLNEFAGKWFAAAPSLLDLEGYRHYHLQHHKYTGQDYQGDKGDPDIILTRNYPISKKSLTKWLVKDLTGRSAPRLYLGLIAMKLGLMRYDLSGRVQMLPRVADMFQNTRTTEVSFLERLTFAPCHVNYHMEHHFLIAVPSYRLPQLHRLLKERGVFDSVRVAHGYSEVLRLATAK